LKVPILYHVGPVRPAPPMMGYWAPMIRSVPALPVGPVIDAPVGPVIDAPVGPVIEAPVGPVRPVGPVIDAPVGPVIDAPVGPVIDAPVGPVGPATTLGFTTCAVGLTGNRSPLWVQVSLTEDIESKEVVAV
jgi:hypothetical protein